MEINEALLQKAPLSEYEKELIRLRDIQGVEITKVATQKGKDKSTISIQHKKALEKLQKFVAEIEYDEISGELMSKIFAAFEKQLPLAQIVIKYKVKPKIVRALHKDWISLKEVDLNSPSVPKRLKQIEEKLANIIDVIAAELKRRGHENPPDAEALRTLLSSAWELIALTNLRCFTDSMYYEFKCNGCGSMYYYAINAKCTKCGRETWWGYHPKSGDT